MSNTIFDTLKDGKAYIITVRTFGIGRAIMLELTEHGTLVHCGKIDCAEPVRCLKHAV